MERSTALSAAGATTLTAAAAVSALFLTVDRGAADASQPTAPAVVDPDVVTEYEVITLDASQDQSASTETATADASEGADESETYETDAYEDEMEDDDENEYPEDGEDEDEYPEDDEDEMEHDDDD